MLMSVSDGIEIRIGSPDDLPAYAQVPIAFQVKSRLRVESVNGGLGGLVLMEEPVAPYTKDYDALHGEGPTRWDEQWDLSNWGLLGTFRDDHRIGGAAVAWNTPGVDMLCDRSDLAVLWDLRVHSDHRGQGVGGELFRAAAAWARERGCRELCVETQNINVPACRFYARQGCTLGAINRYAYPELPDEVQLLWYLALESR
jgi:GNAT superfamily N-acetyltransferase